MTFQELIQQGWADHDSKTAEVADRLEQNVGLVEDGNSAAAFMNLTIHAIGDHLGDRARAASLCEAALKQAGDEPGPGPFLFLAVSRRLAGDDAGADAAQANLGDDPAVPVRVGMLVAQGLMHAGDWDAAAALYSAQIATANALDAGHAGENACAVVSNNVAGELLQLDARTPAQDALMEQAAQNARTYWLRVGTWVNDERADYTLACVYNVLGRAQKGLEHADRGLATIAAGDGEEKVDEAFLHLERAKAYRGMGDDEAHAAALGVADGLAAGFDNDGLTSWFQEERAKAQ